MKLRLKLEDSPSQVYRVECSNTATVAELQEVVIATLGFQAPGSLSFSLNKKDSLNHELNLSQQGIASGDTLWVTGTNEPIHAPQIEIPKSSSTANNSNVPINIDPPDPVASNKGLCQIPCMDAASSNPTASTPLASTSHLIRLMSDVNRPSPQSLMLMAVHSTMLDSGFRLTEDREEDLALFGPSKTWRAIYHHLSHDDLNADEDDPTSTLTPRLCRLVATCLGPSTLTLHAATLPPSPSASQAPSNSIKTLHLNLFEHISSTHLSFLRLPQLINLLKDQLSSHLITRCYTEAGLAPPIGWKVLPREIQIKILTLLDQKDLSAAATSCTEIWRIVCHSDHDEQMTLWADHFKKEFGAEPGEGELASSGGIRAAFVARWMRRVAIEEERKRRAREASEHLRRRGPAFNPGVPFPGRGGYGPGGFMGPNNGVVGGDYDRFPLMGGGLGGGGGIGGMPGGGGGRGGGRGEGFHPPGFY